MKNMKRKNKTNKCGLVVLTAVLAAVEPVSMVYANMQEPAIENVVQNHGFCLRSVSDTDSQDLDSNDTQGLKLTMKTYQHEYKLENGKVYKNIAFEYPYAEGESEAAQTFNKFYQSLYKKWKKATKANLADAKSIVAEREDDICYGDEVSCEIMSSDDNYISILQTGYDYQMGAHGMPYRYSYIFDAKTGKKISPAKVLGITKEELNAKVQKLYIKKLKKNPSAFYVTQEEMMDALKNIDFNNMCYIKNGKMRFYVDPYAIAPYAAGFVETAVKL